ncbi:MAG: serine/threonine-protein kinase [Myxococcota bacterium]
MREAPLKPGDRIDRFTVLRLLGSGGIAHVYHVRHEGLGTEHALKVLQFTGPSLEERLRHEGWVQSRVRHPNVVAVSDAMKVGEMPALLMDLVPGVDLSRWLCDHEPDVALAERLFRDIVAGVRAAHEAGVIHRDLKPANVLLDLTDPERPTARVADFGLVKILDLDQPGLTHTGMPMGTPNYMAPEQIDRPSAVDQRADIHSLGCILYRLVAHRQAFPGDDPVPVFLRVALGRHAPLPEGIPPHIARTIRRCLAVDPAQRPADCDEVLALLDDRALPTPIPPRRRRKGALGLVGRVAVAGSLMLAFGGGSALAVVATAGLLGMVNAAPTQRPCPADIEGQVQLPWVFDKHVGDSWTLVGETPVVALPGGSGAAQTVCALERGTRIAVTAAPIERDGERWLPVRAEALTFGAPSRRSSASPAAWWASAARRRAAARRSAGCRCAARLGRRPRAGSTWTLDRPAYVLAEPSGSAGTVCAVRGGTVVNLYEPPVEDGERWWIPVVVDALLE